MKQHESNTLQKEITELKKRVTALENKAIINQKEITSDENISNDFKDHFNDSKKTLTNFRLTEANRKKISQNEYINYLIYKD
jgi:translation initiation factor 6 (eIF-6)